MSVFRVKLQNVDQGKLDINPVTSAAFTTSKQRTIYAMGPKKVNRKLADGDTFTDCNYWKRFAYPQVSLRRRLHRGRHRRRLGVQRRRFGKHCRLRCHVHSGHDLQHDQHHQLRDHVRPASPLHPGHEQRRLYRRHWRIERRHGYVVHSYGWRIAGAQHRRPVRHSDPSEVGFGHSDRYGSRRYPFGFQQLSVD
jgi:hypothetical protein